jgi:alpha 1,3-glucosidase
MRAHAHLDTRRREPYLLEEPERSYVREAIRSRYVYLPLWYSLFHQASKTGMPVMR